MAQIEAFDPKVQIRREAEELARQWIAHHGQGTCAAANTLFAGVNSPLGRFADTQPYLNPPYERWLDDIAYDHNTVEVWLNHNGAEAHQAPPPSSAAE